MIRRRILAVGVLALASSALLLPGAGLGVGKIDGAPEGLGDVDNRAGRIAPTSQQLSRVSQLGATARFNQFGTVQSLAKFDGGYLASGLGSNPAAAARAFLNQNKVLFRLSSTSIANLDVLTDAPLSGQAGHAVVFRQRFAGRPALLDGIITVLVRGGRVSYASSTSAGDGNAPAAPSLSAVQAWVAAANDVGVSVSVAQARRVRTERGWTVFEVAGLDELQRARFGAVPTPRDGVLPAYETIVQVDHSRTIAAQPHSHGAYKHMIDARNGAVLYRQDIEMNAAQADAEPFAGTLPGTNGGCATKHGPYTAGPNTISIDVTADSPGVDIILNLYFDPPPPGGAQTLVAQSDIPLGPNPEAIHYEPPGGVPEGDYFVEVCDFPDDGIELPAPYTGSIVINDVASISPAPFPPMWEVFPASPLLAGTEGFPWNYPNTDIRQTWCFNTPADTTDPPPPGCDLDVANSAARVPWDYSPTANQATFTTQGNAASSAEAWSDPLTPGAFGFRPVDSDRTYVYPWDNTWFTNRCAQSSLVWPDEPDLPAAVTNLFAMHNRMHDWSYYLGFTEPHWNLQENNFGSPTAAQDPVIGQTQAGAALPVQAGLSRDNANMRTLPDGTSPITNMYLWQPIGGGFYAPCVDGDFDMPVIGHEYGHAIENRMIGKGGTRSGTHAGAMGESFGDFDAVEYLNEVGFVPVNGENPFSVGAYVTGDKDKGIRNFAMNWPSAGGIPTPGVTPKYNPLQFGAIGYDFVCNAPLVGPPIEDPCPSRTQVHADGEIWSATQYGIRQELVQKYNAQFPATDQALQRKCALGSFADDVDQCPGNRRWIQLYYDAMLIMPTNPSMLDARDAMIMADQNRFGGANQVEIWRAFAKRGFGEHAVAASENDPDPKPNHESPVQTNEATVTFSAVESGNFDPIDNATIFVGWYEAGITPIADTDPATNAPSGDNHLDDVAKFVPGTYEFIAQAPGYGHLRFRLNLAASENRNVVVTMPPNFASKTNGAVAFGDGVNHDELIDDTETTNWASLSSLGGVEGDFVVVDLAGTAPVNVRRLQVSAYLRPAEPEDEGGDTLGQSRFTALRAFEIYTCNVATAGSCAVPVLNVNYLKKYTSADDFFPSTAPRPVSPDLILRTFVVAKHPATHVMLRVLDNQCTGGPDFQGDQDNDATNNTDCNAAAAAPNVRAAELQVFARGGAAGAAPKDPAVVLTKTGPATAKVGEQITYTLRYTNGGPFEASNSKIIDTLPAQLRFVSATGGGQLVNGRVVWNLGTVPVGEPRSVTVTVRVRAGVAVGTSILNQAEFTGDLVVSPPIAKAVTLVVQ